MTETKTLQRNLFCTWLCGVLMILMLLGGCGERQSGSAVERSIPDEVRDWLYDYDSLPIEQFVKEPGHWESIRNQTAVTDERRETAVNMLADQSFVEIGRHQAEQFGLDTEGANGKYILVRGVLLEGYPNVEYDYSGRIIVTAVCRNPVEVKKLHKHPVVMVLPGRFADQDIQGVYPIIDVIRGRPEKPFWK